MTFRQLLALITDAVEKLESACDSTGTAIPDLHTPFYPESEAFRANPAAAESASVISAAALQLEAIFTPPHVSLYHIVAGHFKSAAVRVCLESSVTEILREAGPDGLHVKDIASKNGQDPRKLSRFLRYLASNHVYREIKPDVFTNTRISSMMDTLKPSQDIIAQCALSSLIVAMPKCDYSSPETKHDNTLGLAALASHHLDEPFKASAYAWETLSDPATVKSGDPTASCFARAFNAKETLWDLHARDQHRSRRFNIGMRGIQALQPIDAILTAYDWAKLPAGSVVVDVGGGVGSESLPLAREFPALHLVVQDLHSVIEDAKKFWKNDMPNARVTLEVQDFFTPQPADRDVTIFLIKQILHDWSDEYCVKVLIQLRAAARSDTKLLLVESLMPFACHDPEGGNAFTIPGSVPHEAPAPLLANYGAVNELAYSSDMDMFVLFNSQERTIRHFDELLLSTGWKVTKVHRQDGEGTYLQSVEAIAVDIPKL
ncbi:hypothetical protein DXG01_004497 [Tephrocybe rancida]|nr:hypothetical protein DXG01_004497 [Tephrocybe rancida]